MIKCMISPHQVFLSSKNYMCIKLGTCDIYWGRVLVTLLVYFMLSQPTLRREGDAGLTGASSKKGKCAESPPTFIWGKRRKNRKKTWSTNFKWKVQELYLRTMKVLSPHASVKRDDSLLKCANITSICFIFPFLCSYVFLCLLYILSFCGRQGCFPCSYVFLNCGKEIKPT